MSLGPVCMGEPFLPEPPSLGRGKQHLGVGLAVWHVDGWPSLWAPGASLLEHLLGPLGHPGRALLHAAFLSHPARRPEAREGVHPLGFGTWGLTPIHNCPVGYSQASSWVQLSGRQGVLAWSALLCWRRRLHALEHERRPVLGRQERSVCRERWTDSTHWKLRLSLWCWRPRPGPCFRKVRYHCPQP